MKIRICNNSFNYIVLFLIMCLELQVFYLVPTTWSLFGMDYQMICALIEVGLFIVWIIKKQGIIVKGRYHWIIVTGLLLVVTSSIAGMISYNQSFINGLVLQRNRIANFLFYFVIYSWYKEGKITITGIKKLLIVFVTTCAAVYFLQYILSHVVIFTYSTASTKIRYGSIRFWFNTVYMVVVSGMALNNLMRKKNKVCKNLIYMILPVAVIILITKSRTAALSVVAALLVCFLLHRESGKKKIIGICAVILGFFIFSSTSVGQDLLNVFSTGTSQEDTLTVRELGRAYYVAKTSEQPLSFLMGCGYATSTNSSALNTAYPTLYSSAYGYKVMYYPQDNGIFGQFFFYGILGIIWWGAILGLFIRKGYKIYKTSGNTLFIFFAIYEIGMSITSIPVLFGSKVLISFMIIFLANSENCIAYEDNRRINERMEKWKK